MVIYNTPKPWDKMLETEKAVWVAEHVMDLTFAGNSWWLDNKSRLFVITDKDTDSASQWNPLTDPEHAYQVHVKALAKHGSVYTQALVRVVTGLWLETLNNLTLDKLTELINPTPQQICEAACLAYGGPVVAADETHESATKAAEALSK